MIQCKRNAVSVSVDPVFLEGIKKVFSSGEKKDLVDPYLMLDFAGVRVSTGMWALSRGRYYAGIITRALSSK